ncbi:hypothetical protein [Niallia taxi]|uniref:Uncharacterized protein n=1 Tax=Niallia taxi TaxID=2499688 RepID=A0A3S2TQL1_9BACI|nr:hypothetical protein [Niallia taxi]RVT56434.1 hypothetical protein EM808_27485 [Niallia taxi]
MSKKNLDIRKAIKESGLPHWLIAEHIGITDSTFSKWLRKELSDETKERIFGIIQRLESEAQKNN